MPLLLNFLTALAWIVGVPCLIVCAGSFYFAGTETNAKDKKTWAFGFWLSLLPGLPCWAWIIARWM